MSDTPLLKLTGVCAGYGKMPVIHDINMEVEKGKIVTILGSNGVGKTTTIRTILGQTVLSKGSIIYDNNDISRVPTYMRAHRGIAYCPEGRAIFANLTCRENLQAGGYILKSREQYQQNLDWIFSLFPILEERSEQIAESLSGGEQEMLAIGRALMSSPKLVLLDEPSLGLAPQIIQLIAKTLLEINRQGVSILLVEQNASLALDLADYGYLFRKGSVAFKGSAQEMKNNEQVKNVYLGSI